MNTEMINDYKRLMVFKDIGIKLLNQLKEAMSGNAYAVFFKKISISEQKELLFTYMGQQFVVRIELYFDNTAMPGEAYMATYHIPEEKFRDYEEIVSYSFDMNYTVSRMFTSENFAEPYLADFHQNLKLHYAQHNKPFPIREWILKSK